MLDRDRDGAGDRGPLGSVVRALQDPRADDREGRRRHGSAVELAKVNVDENPAVARAFNVQSIPAVCAFSLGQVVDQFIGAIPEAQITEFVQRLAPAPSEADELAPRATRLPCGRPSSSSRITSVPPKASPAC